MRRVQRMGVEYDIALVIEDEDRTQIFCRSGAVEQNELAHLRTYLRNVRLFQSIDDGLQGKAVELEIAVDIGGDRCDEIGAGAPRFQSFLVVVLPDHKDQNCAQADSCGEAGGDQALRRDSMLALESFPD